MYAHLFDPSTPMGRCVGGFWNLAALGSVVVLFLESGAPDALAITGHYSLSYRTFECFFTLIFTLEYGLRLLSSPRPWRYAFSFFGIIDLVTLSPLYILWMWPAVAVEYVTVMRLLRVVRLLRLVKVLRYFDSASVLWDTLHGARKKLCVFFGTLMILLCLFGGMMYVIEGPEHGFSTLPVAVYWAVVTMTTVGYGDITPQTSLGRAVASVLILIGYSIIAIPIGVMSAYMTDVMHRRRLRRYCDGCHRAGHDDDARFCRHCGAVLPGENILPE